MPHGMTVAKKRWRVRELPPLPAQRAIPTIVTRPVMVSSATMIRLNWRTVVAVTCGRVQCNSATISTIGALRCGVGVVVLHNVTLHDNGPPYLIFGEGIGRYFPIIYSNPW